jgi:hypothetical protein
VLWREDEHHPKQTSHSINPNINLLFASLLSLPGSGEVRERERERRQKINEEKIESFSG